jgi:hypothetical protein
MRQVSSRQIRSGFQSRPRPASCFSHSPLRLQPTDYLTYLQLFPLWCLLVISLTLLMDLRNQQLTGQHKMRTLRNERHLLLILNHQSSKGLVVNICSRLERMSIGPKNVCLEVPACLIQSMQRVKMMHVQAAGTPIS